MAEKIAELYVDVNARLGEMDQKLKQAETRSKAASRKITGYFKSVGTSMAAMFGGAAVLMGLKKGFDAFRSLDTGMRRFNTIARLSQKELSKLQKEVVELSNEMGTPTSELTGAMYQAVSAGVQVADVMEFMRVATTGAIGGMVDVETVVDGLTTVLNSFSAEALTTTEALDIMFKTVELGKTTAGELASSYNLAASTAAIAGIKFSELSAAIATITFQGTPTKMAMTQIRQAIIGLNKNLGDGWRKAMTFQEGIEEIIKQAGGSETKLQELVGSVEAVDAILKLSGESAEVFAENLINTANATNAATLAFNEMEKSVGRQIEKMQVKVENLASSLSEDFVTALGLVIRDIEGFGMLASDIFDMIGETIERKFSTKETNKELKKTNTNLDFINSNVRFIGDGFVKIIGKSEELGNKTGEIVGEVKKINDEIESLKKLQEDGNISIERYREIDKEILELQRQITGEVTTQTGEIEKQVEALAEMAKFLPIRREGGAEPSSEKLSVDTEGLEMEFINMEGLSNDISDTLKDGISQSALLMNSMVSSATTIGSALSLGAHTFASQLINALNIANQISNVILSVAVALGSAVSGGGIGGLVSLFARHGGTFEGGRKVAAFAGGGDFIVPSPGAVDSFPMLVSPNERVRVTPTNKVSDELNTMKQLVTAVNNMNENMVAGGDQTINLALTMGSKVVAEEVIRVINRKEQEMLVDTSER